MHDLSLAQLASFLMRRDLSRSLNHVVQALAPDNVPVSIHTPYSVRQGRNETIGIARNSLAGCGLARTAWRDEAGDAEVAEPELPRLCWVLRTGWKVDIHSETPTLQFAVAGGWRSEPIECIVLNTHVRRWCSHGVACVSVYPPMSMLCRCHQRAYVGVATNESALALPPTSKVTV